jgi:hypothetical protein
MKRLEHWAISTLAAVVLALSLWALPSWGQGANPPASTKESGKTSGKGQTAVEQAAKEATLTGCLGGPNAEGAYTLTNGRYKKAVEVGGAEGLDLKAHVGHTVKLTGGWVSSGAAIGEKENAAEKEKTGEKGERHFKATKVDMIAASCTPAGKGKSK